MAGEGISVGNIGGVTINGIRCGLVSEVACYYTQRGFRSGMADGLTEDEARIAAKAGVFLEKMRAKGYSKEDARKAFVQKIVDEAQRVRAVSTAEATTSPGAENTSRGGASESEKRSDCAPSKGQENGRPGE